MQEPEAWIGLRDTSEDLIDLRPTRLLSATLDLASHDFDEGDILPPLWHWLYFVPSAPTGELGVDGHPLTVGLPPSPRLRRRMYAGGEVVLHQQLKIGDQAVREREVVAVRRTTGSSGKLLIITLESKIFVDQRRVLSERQDLIYTEDPFEAHPRGPGEPPAAAWERELIPTSPLLFRFSALTFNSHRIHYDRAYAQHREGYPDVVVHGPLLAILLAQLAESNGFPVRRFSFRARSPLFVDQTLSLRGDPSPSRASLAAYHGDAVIMDATANPTP